MANITKKKEIIYFVDDWVRDNSVSAYRTLIRVKEKLEGYINNYDYYQTFGAFNSTPKSELEFCLETVNRGLKKLKSIKKKYNLK